MLPQFDTVQLWFGFWGFCQIGKANWNQLFEPQFHSQKWIPFEYNILLALIYSPNVLCIQIYFECQYKHQWVGGKPSSMVVVMAPLLNLIITRYGTAANYL